MIFLAMIMFVSVIGCHAVADFGLNQEDLVAQLKVPQCREQCMDKINADDLTCLQQTECSICWKTCASPSTINKVNKSQLDVIKLKILSMIRDGSLTSADITWKSINTPSQCLVTWEISGGGLMGNLLTDTPEVQLSLWPDSKYRVQVTCKNKITGKMSKSLPLLVDTSKAQTHTTTTAPKPKFETTKTTEKLQTVTSTVSTSSVIGTNVKTELSTTSSDNVKVILTRHQNAAASATVNRTWKNQAIKMEATLAIFVSFMLFLVICSIFSVKRKHISDCDKVKLIDNEVETDIIQTQTLHV